MSDLAASTGAWVDQVADRSRQGHCRCLVTGHVAQVSPLVVTVDGFPEPIHAVPVGVTFQVGDVVSVGFQGSQTVVLARLAGV